MCSSVLDEKTLKESKTPESFEPKVVGFCCHFCAYSAADLAGSARIEYTPAVRVVKLMCTGKVDVIHLLKAFEEGADAVFVCG